MRYLRIIWDLADDVQFSRSSLRPLVFAYTDSGRLIAVIFEWVDEDTVYPVTAFEPEE